MQQIVRVHLCLRVFIFIGSKQVISVRQKKWSFSNSFFIPTSIPTFVGFFVCGMKGRFEFIMKLILFIFVISSVFSQEIETEKLRIAVLNASRNSQRVIVEVFTGTLWGFSPSASFAINQMLDEFPETLTSVEWHHPDWSPFGSELPIPEYQIRSEFYGIDIIP